MAMKRFLSNLAMAVLALALLAGCGQTGYVTQQQQVAGATVGFEHPPKADLLKNYDLFVTLKDSAGQPIEGADVVLTMDMPSMPMGVNRPVADPAGGGRYKVTTAFSMEGDWVITVDATAGGTRYTAVFDQVVVPQ